MSTTAMPWQFQVTTPTQTLLFSVGPQNLVVSAPGVASWAAGSDANAVMSFWKNMGAGVEILWGP